MYFTSVTTLLLNIITVRAKARCEDSSNINNSSIQDFDKMDKEESTWDPARKPVVGTQIDNVHACSVCPAQCPPAFQYMIYSDINDEPKLDF